MIDRVEAKIAEQEAAAEAKKQAEQAKLDEMKQWLELATASMIEERKKMLGERQPPSPERLRAMARRFHMAITSKDELETMYVEMLLHIINRLDEDARNQFNIFLAERQEAVHV